MFVDRAKISVRGGDGGNGCCSFRREKFVPKGGPDGGDGGNGGSVYIESCDSEQSLVALVYQSHFRGANGPGGKGSGCHGRNAEPVVIKVPVGTVVFDEEDFELRKIKVCKECGEKLNSAVECPLCHSHKYEYVTKEKEELKEDIVKGNPKNPNEKPVVIAKKGTMIDYYKIKELPFVLRRNISDDTSLYGISDIDLLEQNQISMNKILTKMEENVLKAGSFVTVPTNVNIPNNDETLKIVKLKDPNLIKSFSVQTVQANMQQDNILQEQFYQMGRDSIGITDSYQGKRDTTAESGKAKQVAAAQAAGRMESKRRMKDAAYADLYKLMFKFLLAYCDEPRTFSKMNPDGSFTKGTFNRYNFLEGELGHVYYNDRFLFSVDDASTLATNRSAMWQEATNNLVSGAFGNPADPNALLLYWNIMKSLNYPMAKYALASIAQRNQQLPFELQ